MSGPVDTTGTIINAFLAGFFHQMERWTQAEMNCLFDRPTRRTGLNARENSPVRTVPAGGRISIVVEPST